MWTACILTLFPEMFPGPLGFSLAGQALASGRWSVDAINIRDFAQDRHRSVDDTPAGGGAGMVLRADIMGAAIDGARERRKGARAPQTMPRCSVPLFRSLAARLLFSLMFRRTSFTESALRSASSYVILPAS